jgi:ubiquitin carboxyl-terminal hydrolase 25/28
VRELRKLFEQMITAAASTIRPEKTLAILALTKSTLNAENTSDSGTNGENPIIGPMTQVQALQDSKSTPLDSTMGHCDDAKSDPDSMKAMDLTDSPLNDAKPERPSRPPPIPPRPQDKFQVAEEVARQQDAAEAITNVFDLLSCAFEANGTLRDNEQNDIVKDLFFADVTTVRMSSINSEKTSKTSKTDLQDTIFVTPGDRDRKLCAALDDEFGLSEAEPGITKYEFFERPPPIQIFYPRRLQFDPVTRLSSKNETHLALEKVMYMDRYMGSTPTYPGKQLPELRKKQWRLQDELRILKERRKSLKETDYSVCGNQVDLPAVLEETAALIEGLGKERPDLSPETIKRNPDAFSDHLRQRAEVFRPQIQEIDDLLSQLEKEIDSVFSQCQDHPYRLHAIFMHAGTASGGHYWIYIYDFQKNIWRKYNDEFVTEETEENILNKVEGIHPATSTGIVYVQDEYALEYTEAVCRQIMESGPGDGVDSADIVMKDAEIPVINGVEVA